MVLPFVQAGINDFYKAGSHGQAMASYRADAGKIGSGNSSGAPFNVRFTVTGEEVKQMASNYNNVLDYWYNLRDTVAKTIKGGMLKA